MMFRIAVLLTCFALVGCSGGGSNQDTGSAPSSNTSNTSNTTEITDPTEPAGIDSFISQSYENIDDTDNYLTGPVTIWEKLDGKIQKIETNTKPIGNTDTEKSHKQLPSLAEIQKMRESALH